MKLGERDLTAEVEGDVVVEEKVLVIRRIRVSYRLTVPEDKREVAERVHGVHARFCPVARTLEGAVAIETRLAFAGR